MANRTFYPSNSGGQNRVYLDFELKGAGAAALTKSGEATPGWERMRFTWATRSGSPATKPLRYPVIPLRFEQEWMASTFSTWTCRNESGGSSNQMSA